VWTTGCIPCIPFGAEHCANGHCVSSSHACASCLAVVKLEDIVRCIEHPAHHEFALILISSCCSDLHIRYSKNVCATTTGEINTTMVRSVFIALRPCWTGTRAKRGSQLSAW